MPEVEPSPPACSILSPPRGPAAAHHPSKSSVTEFEVFRLFGEGKTAKEIADRLNLSPKTVSVRRDHIKEKLSFVTSAGMIREAVRWVEAQSQALHFPACNAGTGDAKLIGAAPTYGRTCGQCLGCQCRRQCPRVSTPLTYEAPYTRTHESARFERCITPQSKLPYLCSAPGGGGPQGIPQV